MAHFKIIHDVVASFVRGVDFVLRERFAIGARSGWDERRSFAVVCAASGQVDGGIADWERADGGDGFWRGV